MAIGGLIVIIVPFIFLMALAGFVVVMLNRSRAS